MKRTRDFRPQIRNEKILVLLRGFPGSGKSTKTQALLAKYGGDMGHVVSIDHNWIPKTMERRAKGEYVTPDEEHAEYNKTHPGDDMGLIMSGIKATHKRFRELIDQGITPVIIDDTNVKKEHMRSYAEYADKAGYEIKIEYPDSVWWKEFSKALIVPKKERGPEFEELVKQMNERGNKNGRRNITLDQTKKWADEWDVQPSLFDILGREPTPKYKRPK